MPSAKQQALKAWFTQANRGGQRPLRFGSQTFLMPSQPYEQLHEFQQEQFQQFMQFQELQMQYLCLGQQYSAASHEAQPRLWNDLGSDYTMPSQTSFKRKVNHQASVYSTGMKKKPWDQDVARSAFESAEAWVVYEDKCTPMNTQAASLSITSMVHLQNETALTLLKPSQKIVSTADEKTLVSPLPVLENTTDLSNQSSCSLEDDPVSLVASGFAPPHSPSSSTQSRPMSALEHLHSMMTWSRDILKEHNIVAVAFGPDVTVDEEVISSFDSNMWYSTVTFMALREVMEISRNWILVLSFEELPSRYPITQLITDIAYVNFEGKREHWTVVHVSLDKWEATYFDSFYRGIRQDCVRMSQFCEKAICDVRTKRPSNGRQFPQRVPRMKVKVCCNLSTL